MGEMMWDLFGEEIHGHEQGGLPPGFRFHPTDEELITFYLASKVFNGGLCGVDIVEVDLNRCEPWELPDVAKMGEREWYFFSLRDRKYPTGLRTNRATGAGYWKATGKDREVHAAGTGALVGMKKTLVFYKGRAPRGEKTKWVLHEYRLEGDYSCRHACKEEWVICRIFNKSGADKKSPYCPTPSYFLDPSTPSPPPCLPPLLDLQTLQNPLQSLLQNHHLTYLPQLQEPNHLFSQPSSLQSLLKSHCPPKLISPITPSDQTQQEESLSNWIETYLQNPLIYEVGLGFPLGGGGGGGAAVHDLASMGPIIQEYGPLVP